MSVSQLEWLRDIRQAKIAQDDARAHLEDLMMQAKLAGVSYRQIAEATGLTRSGVQAVLRRTRSKNEDSQNTMVL